MEKVKKPQNSNARISIVFGMFSWMPLLNYIIGIGAIYFGIKALKEIRDQQKHSGKLLALVGIILGLLPYYYFISALVLGDYFNLASSSIAIILTVFFPFLPLFLIFTLKRFKLL